MSSVTESQLDTLNHQLTALRQEIAKVIVGQTEAVDHLLIAMLAGGHALLKGVPGLGKTLMVKTLADAVESQFQRIQFTPDLMPSDIIGAEILEEDHTTGKRFFKFTKGPIFTQILLADEINRTPPKTQAALLEAMQEHAVTYAGSTHALPEPFFVLATQNPIEQAGAYPLPEAQLDRFLLMINIDYPELDEERRILSATTGARSTKVEAAIKADELIEAQRMVREILIDDALIDYVARLIRASRPKTSDVAFIRDYVNWGAGPRAGQALILTAKARALLEGRLAVTPEDLHAMAAPVLRHRILLNFKGEAERIDTDTVVAELINATPTP